MKRLLALLILPAMALAAGASATLSWTLPTTYVDGQPLAVSEIKEILIQWRRPGSPTVVGSISVAPPATSTVIAGLNCGNFQFFATTVLVAGPPPSDETAPASYATGIGCKPNPPTGLTAQ